MTIAVEIAPGELIDKITILEIKLERISDPRKQANIRLEYELLTRVRRAELPDNPTLQELTSRLKEINGRLWTIEDDIRDLERAKEFSEPFINLARSVYRTNDERAAIKREINELLDSAIIEEKSYASY